MKIEKGEVLSNPHARQAYYDELRARRQARPVTQDSDIEIDVSKLQPAPWPDEDEALMAEAQTLADIRRLLKVERMTKKAAQRRLKEIGIN